MPRGAGPGWRRSGCPCPQQRRCLTCGLGAAPSNWGATASVRLAHLVRGQLQVIAWYTPTRAVRRLLTRRAGGLALLVGLTLFVLASASGAITGSPKGWTKPAALASGPGFPLVSVDSSGGSLVVWTVQRGGAGYVLRARWHSAKGRFGPTFAISSPAMAGSVNSNFKISLSPNGYGAILWNLIRGPGGNYVRTLSSTGTMGPIVRLADLGDRNTEATDIAVDDGGRVTVILGTLSGGGTVFAQRLEQNGTLDPPQSIAVGHPTGCCTGDLHPGFIGADRAGDATLTWTETTSEFSGPEIWTETLHANGTLGPMVLVSAATGLNSQGDGLAVAVGRAGNAVFAWPTSRSLRTADPTGVAARILSPSGQLGATRTVLAHRDINDFSVAGLSNGGAVVSWTTGIRHLTVFQDRAITTHGLGSTHTIGSTSCGRFTKCLLGSVVTPSRNGALAAWLPETGYGTPGELAGLQVRVLSTTGAPLHGQTLVPIGGANASQTVLAAGANRRGNAVIVFNSRKRLELIASRSS